MFGTHSTRPFEFFVCLVVISNLMGGQMRYVTADNRDFLLALMPGLE